MPPETSPRISFHICIHATVSSSQFFPLTLLHSRRVLNLTLIDESTLHSREARETTLIGVILFPEDKNTRVYISS